MYIYIYIERERERERLVTEATLSYVSIYLFLIIPVL